MPPGLDSTAAAEHHCYWWLVGRELRSRQSPEVSLWMLRSGMCSFFFLPRMQLFLESLGYVDIPTCDSSAGWRDAKLLGFSR